MKKMVIAFVIICVWFGGAYATSKKKEKAKITIKIATIVPKGVLTSKIMQEFISEVREETKNEVNIKCYWGGVQGDESDVLRKIRLKQLNGCQFYRQKIIGNYIVDFYCPKAKLVIEIDGGQHYSAEGIKRDKLRDDFMREHGLQVLRFSDRDVFENLTGAVERICEYL